MKLSIIGQFLSLILFFTLLTARRAAAQMAAVRQTLVTSKVMHLDAPASPPSAYADIMPHYVGGEKAMLAFVQKRLTYSTEAIAHLKAGIIYVSFVVDAQGRILDPQVVRGVGYGLDEEVVRLVRLMPWWEPGQTHGQAVPVQCTLPVRFRVADATGQ